MRTRENGRFFREIKRAGKIHAHPRKWETSLRDKKGGENTRAPMRIGDFARGKRAGKIHAQTWRTDNGGTSSRLNISQLSQ